MGKFAGKTDMGESAPCSKMSLAQVRKGGVLVTNLGLRYRPCPCRCHPTPGAGMGKATLPAHSPSMAHACVHSNGVLAMHPLSGVRIRPPRRASAGSSGTAEVARKLARLLRSSATHSAGDLLLAGLARRRDLCARASQASELVAWLAAADAISSCCTRSGVAFSLVMSTSSDKLGMCPVTITRPALSSALDSVIRRPAGGQQFALAIV